jgi:TRAP-type uncharacterized transport system fused permease subunit
VFDAIFVALGCAPAIKWFDWLRHRLVPIGLVLMPLVLIAAEVRYPGDLKKGNHAIFANIFLGDGYWGFGLLALWILIAVFSARKLRNLTSEHRTLLAISALLILGSLVAKLLDGGQFGHPTLGRMGWSDSLNRMWIQSFGIFVVTAVVATVQSLWPTKTTNADLVEK